MGLFGSSKYNEKEKALIEEYARLMSMTVMQPSEAKKMAEEVMDRVIKESKESGTYYLPENLGDIILGTAEATDTHIKQLVEIIKKGNPKKKAEGVRDEDIRWWWNLSDVERRLMGAQDDIAKMALSIDTLKKSTETSKEKAQDEAKTKTRKFHPIFGDPEDTTHTTGDDRPLPYELKDRINLYIQKRAATDPKNYKQEMEQSSTFNALIRKEIKAGNL